MRVKDQLSRLDVRPSKSRGQNFIIDESLLDAVVTFGAPSSSDKLIEIGPGLGALTERLLKIAPVIAIEIEEQFCRELEGRFSNITTVNEDVRLVDFSQFGSDLVVFGNLPYRLSTDILFHLVAFSANIRRAVIMVQREFAQRMAAVPGGKEYGVLSVSVQLTASAKLGPTIPGSAFHPPTAVTSQLIELTFRPYPGVLPEEIPAMKRIVAAAFSQRRKMIKNTLKASKIADGDKVELSLEQAGIAGTRRAETVSIDEYIKLTRVLRPFLNAKL